MYSVLKGLAIARNFDSLAAE